MKAWKLPPRAKVFEAFTAVADGRVRITGTGPGTVTATVVSSEGDRTYDVEWSAETRTIAANDNASYWQGYLGYPGLAVLLELGELRAGEDEVRALAGVPWHDLNRRFRREYDAAAASVLEALPGGAEEAGRVERAVDDVLAQLAELGPQRAGRGRRPPKG